MEYGDLVCCRSGFWFRIDASFGIRFRIDPVPYTGVQKSLGNYFRNIRTFQERKWSIPHKNFIRGRRSFSSLPNSWDDIVNRSLRIKSWKRSKKRKQWM